MRTEPCEKGMLKCYRWIRRRYTAPLVRLFRRPIEFEREYTLGPIGREVLELCDGRRDAEAIADVMAERHGWPAKGALKSVRIYLRTLHRRGLVVLTPPAEGADEADTDADA